MFLANSLKEKLRRNYLESDTTEAIETTKYPYKPPKKDPRVLLSFRQKVDGDNQESLIPQNFFLLRNSNHSIGKNGNPHSQQINSIQNGKRELI